MSIPSEAISITRKLNIEKQELDQAQGGNMSQKKLSVPSVAQVRIISIDS